MHIPLALLLLNEVQPEFIVALDSGEVELDILTGLQALSRSSENQALIVVANELGVVLPVFSQFKEYNLRLLIDHMMLSNGLNPTDFKYTEEELQAQAQQEQEAAQAQQQQLIAQQGSGQLDATQAAQLASGMAQ